MANHAIRVVLLSGLLVTSVCCLKTTEDAFRLPKELAVRAEAIILLTIASLFSVPSIESARAALQDPAIVLPVLIVAWTLLSSSQSILPLLSWRTLVWVIATAVVFIITYAAATDYSLRSVYPVLWAGVINAAVAIVQEARAWRGIGDHMSTVGFVGNPDDLGAFLVAPLLTAAAILFTKGVSWQALTCTTLLFGGLAVAQSAGALVATCAGLALMAALQSWRRFGRIGLALAVFGVSIGLAMPSMRDKLSRYGDYARGAVHGDRVMALEGLSSNRVAPAVVAWQMFTARPVFGVGPGCYSRQYFFESIRAHQRFPSLRESGTAHLHFAEAHNDHLQTLAVAGVPGYLLFIAAPAILIVRSNRARGTDQRSVFARLCGPPLAVSFFLLSMVGFPLELAAPTMMFLYLAALVMNWSRNA